MTKHSRGKKRVLRWGNRLSMRGTKGRSVDSHAGYFARLSEITVEISVLRQCSRGLESNMLRSRPPTFPCWPCRRENREAKKLCTMILLPMTSARSKCLMPAFCQEESCWSPWEMLVARFCAKTGVSDITFALPQSSLS